MLFNFLRILYVLSICFVSTSYGIDKCRKIKVTALILARGGSKGLPLKNLVKINGTSLLRRAINVLHEATVFDEIWVSSDHFGILNEARRSNAQPHYRSPQYALDNTTSIQSVQEFLQHHTDINYLALIQCTSVFLKVKYLHRAIDLFQNYDCIFSVTASYKLRWIFDRNSSVLRPLNFSPTSRPRRQDWNGELVENGMFYFSDRILLERGYFQNLNCSYVEIEGRDSLEIDSPYDLKLAEYLNID